MSDKKESYVLTKKEYEKLLLAVAYAIMRSDLALLTAKKTDNSLKNLVNS